MTWLLFPLLCSALYYLGSRALVTRWLWSRYPAWLNSLALCSACVGFWAGCGCAAMGWQLELALAPLSPRHWATVPLTGLVTMVLTPLVSYLHIACLAALAPPEDGHAEE